MSGTAPFGAIFVKTLRFNWRAILTWGGGLAALAIMIMVIFQDADTLQGYADIVESLPPALTTAFGIGDAAALTTPDGFVGFGFFTYALLITAVFAVLAGMDITANEEDNGILDIVLSLPVPRWQVLVERYLAYVVITIGIAAMAALGIIIGESMSTMAFSLEKLLPATLNIIPGTLVMIAMTVFFSVILRRKMHAISITAGIIVASYFFDFLAELANNAIVNAARAFSVFTYYDGQGVIQNGLDPVNVLIPLVAAVVLVAGAVWFFQRRDVGL